MSSKRRRDAPDDAAAAEDGLSTPEKRQRLSDGAAAAKIDAAEAAAAPNSTTADSPAAAREDAGEGPAAAAEANGRDDASSDDEPVLPSLGRRGGVKKGNECPYLDTVSRQVGSSSGTRFVQAVL